MRLPRIDGVRRDGLVIMIGQLALGGIGFITAPLLARALGPVARGEYAAALVWAITLGPIAGLGSGLAARILISEDPRRRRAVARHAFAIAAVVALLVAVVTAALLPLLLPGYSDEIIWLGRAALLSLPIVALLAVVTNLLAADKRYVVMSVITTSGAVATTVLLVALYVTHALEVTSAVIVFLAGTTIPLLIGLLVVRRRSSRAPDASLPAHPVRLARQIRFGAKLASGQLAALATQRLDQLLLAAFVSAEQLGFYVMAVTISTVARMAGGSVAFMAMTRVAETAAEERRRVIGRAIRMNMLVTVPICLIGIALAPWAVPLLLGPGFEPVVGLLQLMLVATAGFSVMDTAAQCLAASGVVGPTVRATILGAAITVALLVLFLSRYGATAAAWASIVSYWTVGLVLLVSLRRRGLARFTDMVPRRDDVRSLLRRAGDDG